jgi:hypothetical protein
MHPASPRALLEWLMFMQIGFLLKQVGSCSTSRFLKLPCASRACFDLLCIRCCMELAGAAQSWF